MAITLYELTVPIFLRSLQNLSHCLKKGQASGLISDPTTATLAPDMKSLPFQIQTCSNTAKNTISRLVPSLASSIPAWEDNETTFEQLQERIAKTIELLKGVDPKGFEGAETAEVVMKTQSGEMKFTGLSYVQNFAVPNFFFHVVVAYGILRNKGVEVGKLDYLMGAQ
jgi:uncharacterized protein